MLARHRSIPVMAHAHSEVRDRRTGAAESAHAPESLQVNILDILYNMTAATIYRYPKNSKLMQIQPISVSAYLVISEADCQGKDILYVAEQAILGGVDIIQLREKHTSTPAFIEKALRLKEITEKHQIPLIINDNLKVAIEVNAFGIHVGNSDTSPTVIRG
ncbi:hypothetical protein FQR65_LT17231 [Abscondita terminalis]|nr:hypothetical protein FQR65_LT17231 [Abscondita terminalis]